MSQINIRKFINFASTFSILMILLAFGLKRPGNGPVITDAYLVALERIQVAENTQDTYLSLGNLGLTDIPIEIGNLEHLEVLDLSENYLSDLPPQIRQLSNLKSIRLSYNHFADFPNEITHLAYLQNLWIDNNELNRVPSSISRLSNLQKLYLDGNNIEYIPSQVGTLVNLQVLSLTYNELHDLPDNIGNLDNLCFLDFGYNYFEELPEGLGHFYPIAMNSECANNRLNLIVQPNPYEDDDDELANADTNSLVSHMNSRMTKGNFFRSTTALIISIFTVLFLIMKIAFPKQKRKSRKNYSHLVIGNDTFKRLEKQTPSDTLALKSLSETFGRVAPQNPAQSTLQG